MIPPNVRQRSFVELSLVTLSPADLAPFEVSSQESPELPSEGLRRLPRPGAARERILLVEDDRSIRVALQGILEDEGYAVTAADNGRQALERL